MYFTKIQVKHLTLKQHKQQTNKQNYCIMSSKNLSTGPLYFKLIKLLN